MQNRMQTARANAQAAAQVKETAFFAGLKSKGISSTPSGLCYEILQQGAEKKPAATDLITVNYTGRLLDGKVFDSTTARGKPATFTVNGVIPGWTEALLFMSRGEKCLLVIPPELGYGVRGYPGVIPPNSFLVFEVELIDF